MDDITFEQGELEALLEASSTETRADRIEFLIAEGAEFDAPTYD